MGQPFLGEIRMFAGNFAPVNWHLCDGTLLPISENEPLFNLLGTTYGGNGVTNFQLPNLLGRVPIHQGTLPGGSTYIMGQLAGNEGITLQGNQVPSHNHVLNASIGGTPTAKPGGQAPSAAASIYSATLSSVPMAKNIISPNQGGQPHDNRMPYLAINFIISLAGIYPSQG